MNESTEALGQPFCSPRLIKERDSGSPRAILLAQIFLFLTSLCIHETTFSSKHDAGGIKIALSYHIVALLLPYSKLLSGHKFFRKGSVSKVNLIANSGCFVLAILFESFYEKTLASLGVVLSTAFLVLLLLIITRPRNDLGIFGFFTGVAASISPSLYRLGYKTWVVVAICIALLVFKWLLDRNWMEVEEDHETLVIYTNRSQENKTISKLNVQILLVPEALIVSVFFLYWDQLLFRTNCRNSDNSCASTFNLLLYLGMILCLWISIAIGRYLHLEWHPEPDSSEVKGSEMGKSNEQEVVTEKAKMAATLKQKTSPEKRRPPARYSLRQRPKQR